MPDTPTGPLTVDEISSIIADNLMLGQPWSVGMINEAAREIHRRLTTPDPALDTTTPGSGFVSAAEMRRMFGIDADGALLILDERRRQVDVEGWTASHDDAHDEGDLVYAAVAYASVAWAGPAAAHRWWPWNQPWKPSTNPVRNLVRAGALLAAEIDRLIRAGSSVPPVR